MRSMTMVPDPDDWMQGSWSEGYDEGYDQGRADGESWYGWLDVVLFIALGWVWGIAFAILMGWGL